MEAHRGNRPEVKGYNVIYNRRGGSGSTHTHTDISVVYMYWYSHHIQ